MTLTFVSERQLTDDQWDVIYTVSGKSGRPKAVSDATIKFEIEFNKTPVKGVQIVEKVKWGSATSSTKFIIMDATTTTPKLVIRTQSSRPTATTELVDEEETTTQQPFSTRVSPPLSSF